MESWDSKILVTSENEHHISPFWRINFSRFSFTFSSIHNQRKSLSIQHFNVLPLPQFHMYQGRHVSYVSVLTSRKHPAKWDIRRNIDSLLDGCRLLYTNPMGPFSCLPQLLQFCCFFFLSQCFIFLHCFRNKVENVNEFE